MAYNEWKASVLGRVIGDGQCVALIVNNPQSYTANLFPGVSWPNIVPPVSGAREMAGRGNQYLQWIANNPNDVNQLPQRGDIMVFDATPRAGYSNTYYNPYGHTGVCDYADSGGYNLLQQNSPSNGSPAGVTRYAWRFRPTMGWLRPVTQNVPAPAPAPVPVGHTIYLPPTTGPWHFYNENGPYNYSNPANVRGLLYPSQFGGLTYNIVAFKGNGVVVIDSQMFGRGALYTNGSNVIIK